MRGNFPCFMPLVLSALGLLFPGLENDPIKNLATQSFYQEITNAFIRSANVFSATFVVDLDAPPSPLTVRLQSLADCYQRCLHPKLCTNLTLYEALPSASCVQGCGRNSETRLCCPTCIEPGNSILWYLHFFSMAWQGLR